jgi:hypothetical protein
MTNLDSAFHDAVADCDKSPVALLVYHRTGSAVVEQVSRACQQAAGVQADFRPRLSLLGWAGREIRRFFYAKIAFHHFFVLDTAIPPGPSPQGLDHLVERLGYHVNDKREIQGSRGLLLQRWVLLLLTFVGFSLARYAPAVLTHPLVADNALFRWLLRPESLGYTITASLVGAALAALGLFVYLESRANLVGLFRPRPQVNNVEQEIAFIVEEVGKRQTRGWLSLLVLQPLVYLLALGGLLPLLHLVRLVRYALQRRQVALPGRKQLDRDAVRSLLWLLADGLILAGFLVGSGWLPGPPLPGGPGVWNGVFFSSWLFLAIGSVRETWKLLRTEDLPVAALDRLAWLRGCAVVLWVVLLGSLVLWWAPAGDWPVLRSLLGPATLLLLATVVLAVFIRPWTQSRNRVMIRVADVQRLGDDCPRLYAALRDAIPGRLLVIALWDTDETPETLTGYRCVHVPPARAGDLGPMLRKLLPRRFGMKKEDWANFLDDLEAYVLRVCRDRYEPCRWFEERIACRSRETSAFLRCFYAAMPELVRLRRSAYPDPHERVTARPSHPEGWKQAFEDLLAGLPAADKVSRETLRELVAWVREWETDALRFHLDALARRYQERLPDYTGHLVRLALFVHLRAAEQLALEAERPRGEHSARPAHGVPVSLCREAGLFAGMPAVAAGRYTDDYRREGFLESADPVIFSPGELSFLATAYLSIPVLYGEHDGLIRQLTQAGRGDARFLKVAAACARRIQQDDYVQQLPAPERRAPDAEDGRERSVLSPQARMELLLRSVTLLLAYYERVAREGLPGVEKDRLDAELLHLAGTEEAGDDLSILALLAVASRQSEHAALVGPHRQRYRERVSDLGERWLRLQVQRHLLAGSFAPDGDSPTELAAQGQLDALLREEGGGSPAPGRYDARAAHHHYHLGYRALESGRPLSALAEFARAAARAYQVDDALYARVQHQAARALSRLHLYGWAADQLERLYQDYGVYLRDDPVVPEILLSRARAEARLHAHEPHAVWTVPTRWIAPVESRAADLPGYLQALLAQTRAVYEEKRGAADEALQAARESHCQLRLLAVRRWQGILVQLDLARLARRTGHWHEVESLLDDRLRATLARFSPLGYLEACQTLARDFQARAHFKLAEDRWLEMVRSAVAVGGAPEEKAGNGSAAGDLEDRLDGLLHDLRPAAGAPVPWCKVLQAACELSEIARRRATSHHLGQLLDAERRRRMQANWYTAYRLLTTAYNAFRSYLAESRDTPLIAEAPPLAPGVSRFLDRGFAARHDPGQLTFLDEHFATPRPPAGPRPEQDGLTLDEVYFDLRRRPDGKLVRALTPPLRQVLYQLYHAHEMLHMGLTLFLPGPAEAAAGPDTPAARLGQADLVTRDGSDYRLNRPVRVAEYLDFLEKLSAEQKRAGNPVPANLGAVNSATLRALCEFCRMFFLRLLFPRPEADLKEMARVRSENHHPDDAPPEVGSKPGQAPATAYLLLRWEHLGDLGRLRWLFHWLLLRLDDPEACGDLDVGRVERVREALRKLAEHLHNDHDESPTHIETLHHRLHRELNRLRGRPVVADGPAGKELLSAPALGLLPSAARDQAEALLPYYEEALTQLLSAPENDLYESVLNRVALLEGLRDASLFFHDHKRELFLSGMIQSWGLELFRDLDRLHNHALTAYVKHGFFPHWDDIRQSLRDLQSTIRHLEGQLRAAPVKAAK